MLTSKQERFTQNLFNGMTQREAWIQAGYSHNYSMARVDSHACELANSVKIKDRLEELNQPVIEALVSSKIMDKQERLERLSEIGRARLIDFVKEGEPTLGADMLNNGAVADFYIKHGFNKAGEPVVTKAIRLHNPVTAMETMNKMDKLYSEVPTGYQDNRVFNVIVGSEMAKELTQGVKGFKVLNRGQEKDPPQDVGEE